jgi:signal transduction histidine kinase
VRHGDEGLGMLVLRERAGAPLTPVEERLFADLAAQAGLVLRGARLRAALEQRLGELSDREEELRRSRERLVDAQDDARRRLERDIHDGAQQHLVALAVNLRLAATLAVASPERAEALLAAQEDAAEDAVATLLQLSRGIYPPLLEEAGVAAALRAAAGEGVAVVERGTARYPIDIEAAAYFCCLEAIQNAAKHADAASTRVEVDAGPDALVLTVTDDGAGFDPARAAAGSGLANIRDRVDSAGGTLQVTSHPGQGTTVRAVIPCQRPVAAEGVG